MLDLIRTSVVVRGKPGTAFFPTQEQYSWMELIEEYSRDPYPYSSDLVKEKVTRFDYFERWPDGKMHKLTIPPAIALCKDYEILVNFPGMFATKSIRHDAIDIFYVSQPDPVWERKLLICGTRMSMVYDETGSKPLGYWAPLYRIGGRDLLDRLRSISGACEVLVRRYFEHLEDDAREWAWDGSIYREMYGEYKVLREIYYDL